MTTQINSMQSILEDIKTGRLELAKKKTVKELTQNKTNAQAWVFLGEYLERINEKAGAWFAYETAWILDPQAGWWSEKECLLYKYRNDNIPNWVSNIRKISKKTVAAVIIARNEANTIFDCVTALKPAMDEVIVIDTGSTDNTKTLAKQAGATLYEFEWIDDFSAARNFGLSKVTSDWTLFIDADEILKPDDIFVPRLVAGIYDQSLPIAALRIGIENQLEDHSELTYDMVRMIPTKSGLRWWNRIHEQIGGPNGLTDSSTPHRRPAVRLRVDHTGYMHTVMQTKNKLERNTKLLEKSIQDNPEDIGSWGFLGREYFFSGKIQEALFCFQKTEELFTIHTWYVRMDEVYQYWVQALLQVSRTQEAIAIAERALLRETVSPGLLYLVADIKMRTSLQLMEEAKDIFKKSFESSSSFRGLVYFDPDISKWKAAASIADTNRFLGNWNEAWEWYQQANKHGLIESVAKQQQTMKQQAKQLIEK